MSGPVVAGLLRAAREEEEQRAIAISVAVARQIGPPTEFDAEIPAEFAAWCSARGLQPIPAWPAAAALFVLNHQELDIGHLAKIVRDISSAHLGHGRSDPCAGYPVATVLNKLAGIDPPRSWPKVHKARFQTLPYELQSYLAQHDGQREKEIRRAHDEAARARQELKTIQEGAKCQSNRSRLTKKSKPFVRSWMNLSMPRRQR